MSSVNRKMRRAAEKKAFRHDSKMSDVNKELATMASEETLTKMTAGIAKLMIRAFCLTADLRFKDITKKETRNRNMIAIAHEYSQKIMEKQLSREESELLREIDKELDRFSEAKAKEEQK